MQAVGKSSLSVRLFVVCPVCALMVELWLIGTGFAGCRGFGTSWYGIVFSVLGFLDGRAARGPFRPWSLSASQVSIKPSCPYNLIIGRTIWICDLYTLLSYVILAGEAGLVSPCIFEAKNYLELGGCRSPLVFPLDSAEVLVGVKGCVKAGLPWSLRGKWCW